MLPIISFMSNNCRAFPEFNKYLYPTKEKGNNYFLVNKKGNRIFVLSDGWCSFKKDVDNGFEVKLDSYNEHRTPSPVNINFQW